LSIIYREQRVEDRLLRKVLSSSVTGKEEGDEEELTRNNSVCDVLSQLLGVSLHAWAPSPQQAEEVVAIRRHLGKIRPTVFLFLFLRPEIMMNLGILKNNEQKPSVA